ncbi:hypothetical protein NECAME_12428 [Necator americanus]|uniref:Uncharacterized protein n=1 Tax=Necator americanus TaxID=51031 RepID=W2T0G0_NECAM|nr:hypothetical protein NECAME_12428 [Necator americanus]ETN75373.1 hypothetical protein NECAME_12428 [Necator americanus]
MQHLVEAIMAMTDGQSLDDGRRVRRKHHSCATDDYSQKCLTSSGWGRIRIRLSAEAPPQQC